MINQAVDVLESLGVFPWLKIMIVSTMGIWIFRYIWESVSNEREYPNFEVKQYEEVRKYNTNNKVKHHRCEYCGADSDSSICKRCGAPDTKVR